jgi:hypothetical protein
MRKIMEEGRKEPVPPECTSLQIIYDIPTLNPGSFGERTVAQRPYNNENNVYFLWA